VERHLPYGITQSYLPPDTGERAHLNPTQPSRLVLDFPTSEGWKAELIRNSYLLMHLMIRSYTYCVLFVVWLCVV